MGVRDYALTRLAKDVVELVEALGFRRCVLVAHDWGAAVAWHVAHRYPGIVVGLFNLSIPHPKVSEKMMTVGQLRKSWYMFAFQLPMLGEIIMAELFPGIFSGPPEGGMAIRDPERSAEFAREKYGYFEDAFRRPGAVVAIANYYRALIRNMVGISLGSKEEDREMKRALWRKLDIPVMLIGGENDGAIAPKPLLSCQEMYHQRPKELVTCEIVPNCSHWVQHDVPDLVDSRLTTFLSKF